MTAATHQSPCTLSANKGRRLLSRASSVVILSRILLLFTTFSLISIPWLIASIERDISQPIWTTSSLGSNTLDERFLELERKLAEILKLNVTKVRSCRRQTQMTEAGRFELEGASCRPTSGRKHELMVAYNPVSYERTWCGMKVPPSGIVNFTKACREPLRVFDEDPTLDGDGMPAMFLSQIGAGMADGKTFPCDIPCKTAFNGATFATLTFQGTALRIVFSMESSKYYSNLAIDDQAYKSNKYYATTSFRSEIPLPYFSWAEYNISNPAVDYDKAIRGASFLAKNCASNNGRESLVKDLMEHTRVDALSLCLHNADRPPGVDTGGLQGKINLMRAYLFHLAFENSNEPDYITEKLWGTLAAGTLPVYYGAPNVKDHAPPNSIISRHDFNSSKDLALYLNEVAANKTLYESFHAWRSKPLADSFQRKYDFTNTHSTCRMCRWAYAKKYGFGWDHESQKVQKLHISRRVQYDAHGHVKHPFRESWPFLSSEKLAWKRTVWQHDGVVDLHFEAAGTRMRQVYRMDTDVRKFFRKFESNLVVLQNDLSRMTILTSWDAAFTSPRPGTVDIALEPAVDFLRVRLVVEDVDTFHKGADNATNYFGDFMTKDFFSPMEYFLVDRTSLNLTTHGIAPAA